MIKENWMEDADYVYPTNPTTDNVGRLFGEDENADWWVPCFWRRGFWRRFNRRNPLDWLRYWNSYRRKQVVFLEWLA